MSLIQEAPVFQLIYDELKAFHLLRKKFDKGERYSLGEKTEQTLLDVLLEIIKAGTSKNEWKIAAIDSASKHLEVTKILLRLANDMEQIEDKHYEEHQERISRAGRMLGGWRKAS